MGRQRRRRQRAAVHHRPVYQISRIGPFEPFGHTQFRRYTIAAIFSFSAFFIHMLVRGWLVNELTDSPLLVSLVLVLFISPMLVFTLVGGEISDRFRRTRVLAIGESVVFLTYLGLAVLVFTDVVQAWHVLLLTAAHGVAAATYGPARQSMIGDLVRPRLQRRALGLVPATFNLAQITGPLAGGILLELAGAGVTSAVGAALLLPAIPMYLRLKPVMKSTASQRGGFLQNIREGTAYIVHHRLLRWYLVAGFALVITVNTWTALLPSLAKDVLNMGAGGLAALQVAVGVGALLGSVFAASLATALGDRRLSLLAGFAFAGMLLAIGISQEFVLSVFLAGLAAGFAMLYFVTNMITMQLTADPAFRSRVISVRFIMFGFGPVGMIVLGSIAEVMGTRWAFAIAAISGAVLLAGISMFLGTGEENSAPASESKLSTR